MAVLTKTYNLKQTVTLSNIIYFPFWNKRSQETFNGGWPKPIGIWLQNEFMDIQFNTGISELEYCSIFCKIMKVYCGSPA